MRHRNNAPGAFICEECHQQQKTSADVDEFYCVHNHVWAIRRPDGGWLLSTDISPEDHKALLEDARQLQLRDESGAFDGAKAIRVH